MCILLFFPMKVCVCVSTAKVAVDEGNKIKTDQNVLYCHTKIRYSFYQLNELN